MSEQPRSIDVSLQEACVPERSEANGDGGSASSDEMHTITGARIDGAASLAGQIDQTSYEHQTVRIGTVEVALEDVLSFTVAAPEALRPQ